MRLRGSQPRTNVWVPLLRRQFTSRHTWMRMRTRTWLSPGIDPQWVPGPAGPRPHRLVLVSLYPVQRCGRGEAVKQPPSLRRMQCPGALGRVPDPALQFDASGFSKRDGRSAHFPRLRGIRSLWGTTLGLSLWRSCSRLSSQVRQVQPLLEGKKEAHSSVSLYLGREGQTISLPEWGV